MLLVICHVLLLNMLLSSNCFARNNDFLPAVKNKNGHSIGNFVFLKSILKK